MPGTPALHGRRSLVGWSSLRFSQHQIVSLDRIPCTLRLPLIRFTTLPKANTQRSATRGFLVCAIREGAAKIGDSLQRLPQIVPALFAQDAGRFPATSPGDVGGARSRREAQTAM